MYGLQEDCQEDCSGLCLLQGFNPGTMGMVIAADGSSFSGVCENLRLPCYSSSERCLLVMSALLHACRACYVPQIDHPSRHPGKTWQLPQCTRLASCTNMPHAGGCPLRHFHDHGRLLRGHCGHYCAADLHQVCPRPSHLVRPPLHFRVFLTHEIGYRLTVQALREPTSKVLHVA